MRLRIASLLFALSTLVACGPGDKMDYVCTLQWSCNGETHEKQEQVCLEEDNPQLCDELLEQLDVTCDGRVIASEQSCVCEGVTTRSCPQGAKTS